MRPDSFSPADHLRHFMYEDVYSSMEALLTGSLFKREQEPVVFDFGSMWYGDPDGGWATNMRSMLKVLLPGGFFHRLCTYPEWNIEKLSDVKYGSVDILIADQVLEHVERPWRAAHTLAKVVRYGGLIMVATPGLYPVHKSPLDCWRIMPDGYEVLFPSHLWQNKVHGAWGTRERLVYEYFVNKGFPDGPPEVSVAQAKGTPHYAPEYDGRHPLMLWLVAQRTSQPIRGDEW